MKTISGDARQMDLAQFERYQTIVADPFLGRGATAVACQVLGWRFVGCDIQEHWVEATRARLAEARGEMHLRPRRPVEPPKAPEGQIAMWELLE